MIEIKDKRSYTAKHFDKGNGEFVMNAHIGHIHYFNKLGVGDSKDDFREIDWTLSFDDIKRGWSFEYHNFHPLLPEYADEWVEFRDLFQGKDQTIRYKAQCEHVLGRLVKPEEIGLKETDVNCVIYDDAFGKGYDYILYFTRTSLKKVVRIREEFKKVETDLTFDFEVEFPKDELNKELDIIRAEKKEQPIEIGQAYKFDLAVAKQFDTAKQMLIGNDKLDGKEWFTYIRPFVIWDNNKKETIKVDYFIKDGKRYLRKIVSKYFLDNSEGVVYTDTTTNYATGSGDGIIYLQGYTGTWTALRAASVATGATTAEADRDVQETNLGSPQYYVNRSFFPTDTSGLPDTCTISAAEFYIYVSASTEPDGGATDFNLVGTSQPSMTALAKEDWDLIGTTLWSDDVLDASAMGASPGFYHHHLNATGLAGISKTGYTPLGIRGQRDMSDATPPSGNNFTTIRHSEYSGTSSDPYLAVTYSTSTTVVKTITAKARIKILGVIKSITSKARIKQAGRAKTITAKGRVKKSGVVKTVTAKANIMGAGAKYITAKARVKKLGIIKTITAKSRIKKTGLVKTITAKGKVKQPNLIKTITAKGRVKKANIVKTVTAKAKITGSATVKTIQAKADIKKLGVARSITARAYLLGTTGKNILVKARIWAAPIAGLIHMKSYNQSNPKSFNDGRNL
jgi:hypothetical protein